MHIWVFWVSDEPPRSLSQNCQQVKIDTVLRVTFNIQWSVFQTMLICCWPLLASISPTFQTHMWRTCCCIAELCVVLPFSSPFSQVTLLWLSFICVDWPLLHPRLWHVPKRKCHKFGTSTKVASVESPAELEMIKRRSHYVSAWIGSLPCSSTNFE